MFNSIKLKQLMLENNITVKELADKVNLSEPMIYKILRGSIPSVKSLTKISSEFGVGIDYFMEEKAIYNTINRNTTEMTISNQSIEELIRQNSVFQQQVSDLLKMQLLNAETINNLSHGLKKKAI